MEELKDRIKAVRKDAGLTQEKFGEIIGVGKMAVTYYEGGKRTPAAPTLKMIAEKFQINETWLLTGDGEMKEPLSREDEMAQLAADLLHCDDKFIKEVTRELLAMTSEQISAMKGIILHLADVIKSE